MCNYFCGKKRMTVGEMHYIFVSLDSDSQSIRFLINISIMALII